VSFYIAVGMVLLWFFLVGVVKQLHQDAKERWEEDVMANYLRAEDVRAHRWRLEEIEAVRRSTTEGMIREAQRAGGEIVEGPGHEVERR
jgi:hypothetical protein